MDGYELIENLRKSSIYNNTPVFVISGGHVERENILSRLENLNVSNFYEKPVDLEALIAELDNKLFITTDNLESGAE
jgi:CheY-like chemotaxis protein